MGFCFLLNDTQIHFVRIGDGLMKTASFALNKKCLLVYFYSMDDKLQNHGHSQLILNSFIPTRCRDTKPVSANGY